MGTFQTSEGERLEKSVIDYRIKKAKHEFAVNAEIEAPYCWACERPSAHLTISHIISVNNCQNDGMTEWAWNKDNFQLECTDYKCHEQTEIRKFDHHANANYKHKLIEQYEREKRSRGI